MWFFVIFILSNLLLYLLRVLRLILLSGWLKFCMHALISFKSATFWTLLSIIELSVESAGAFYLVSKPLLVSFSMGS